MSCSTSPTIECLPAPMVRRLHAFGDQADFFLTGEQSGGRYTGFYLETPPGGGPPPHWHENEDEWFFVLEGEAEFFVDGTWAPVPAGSGVFAPRGSIHAFRNAGTTPLRQVIHTSPSGFETFFARISEEFQRDGGPDMRNVVAISGDHGIRYA